MATEQSLKQIAGRDVAGFELRLVVEGWGKGPGNVHIMTYPIKDRTNFDFPEVGEMFGWYDDTSKVTGIVRDVSSRVPPGPEKVVEFLVTLSDWMLDRLPFDQREPQAKEEAPAPVPLRDPISTMPRVVVLDHGQTRRALPLEGVRISGPCSVLEQLAQAILKGVEIARGKGKDDPSYFKVDYTWIDLGDCSQVKPLLDTFPTEWDQAGWMGKAGDLEADGFEKARKGAKDDSKVCL